MTKPEWTLATLRIYLEALIAAVDRQLVEHQATANTAGRAAFAAMEKRLDGMNEFRNTLRDQASTFITRDEADATHQRLVASMGEMWITIRLAMPRAEVESQWARNATVSAELWAAVRACIPRVEYDAAHQRVVDQLDEVARRLDRSEGRSTGLSSGWGYLLAGVAALGALVSIYIALNHL